MLFSICQEMKLFVFILGLTFTCAFSEESHELKYVIGCSTNGTVEVSYVLDGDMALYADFQKNEVVLTVPSYVHFDISPYPTIFRNAVKAKKTCLVAQTIAQELFKDMEVPEVKDPPESMLYPAYEVRKGEVNNLVCFVNRYYPPEINVTWTKNNLPVSDGVSTSLNMPNEDQTFHCFSTLTFTPKHGDIYSCTVRHPALDMPKTRIWDVDLRPHQDLAFDLYCGVGLTVAFVGVAVGTFLIVKGRYGHRIMRATNK